MKMKGMSDWLATLLALVLLGWVTACAGTGGTMAGDDMMDEEKTMAGEDAAAGDGMVSGEGMTDEKSGMASRGDGGMGMEKERSAMLTGSDGHHAAGKAAFGTGMNNSRTLILSDIKVDEVPDGYVYLAKDGDWMHGVQLGMLKQFTGTVSYKLPEGVNPDDYDTVVIWCRKFDVEIGRAHFGEKRM